MWGVLYYFYIIYPEKISSETNALGHLFSPKNEQNKRTVRLYLSKAKLAVLQLQRILLWPKACAQKNMICRFDPLIFVFFEKIYLSAFDKRLFLFLIYIFMIHPTYLSASEKYIFGNVIGPTDFHRIQHVSDITCSQETNDT